jgi:hypothetical protein
VLFMNTFWGYYEWRKELTGYDRGERAREA